MITLFHAPKSRSSRFIFLLEELGAPYEIKIVNIRRGDGSGALDAANPHPHGKAPVNGGLAEFNFGPMNEMEDVINAARKAAARHERAGRRRRTTRWPSGPSL